MHRKIIHIDMDAFYASVEQRENPELRGKPVAVGGSSDRGVVAAASYEARKYGVRSALASSIAIKRCPNLIFVKPRFDLYKEVSEQVRAIFYEYTDKVEPLSLDEAYLDVTENKINLNSGTLIAQQIREKIFKQTQLTASAGVSVNKFLAKVASDINKPNGIKVILPHEVIEFINKLPIEKFHGIGKVTAKKMREIGIRNGKDLSQRSEYDLAKRFGKVGRYYYNISRGIDNRPVEPNRLRKSVSVENTFREDLSTIEDMMVEVKTLAASLKRRLDRAGKSGRTFVLKVKYANFQTVTRSKTVSHELWNEEELVEICEPLLRDTEALSQKVRLLGLGIANLTTEDEEKILLGKQLTFDFEWEQL